MTEPDGDCQGFEDIVAEAVKERDFVVFRPWQLGRGENEMTWMSRTVERLANENRLDKGRVHDSLEAALARRKAKNKRGWWRRGAALVHWFYCFVVKRTLALGIVLPLLRWRHVGSRQEPTRTSFRIEPNAISPDAPPTASIVVLSYNRLAYLRSTLESLIANTPRNEFELIVVDNGSTDGSVAALRGLAERGAIDKLILSKRNRGTAPGFNIGFAYADPSSRYIVKLDSDIKLLTSDWLERFDRFFKNVPDAGMLALYQVNHPRLMVVPRDQVAGEKVISWNWWPIGSACMTIPRSIFQRLGYFCEDFKVKFIWDDVDYSKRVFLLGLQAYYLREASSYHRFDLDPYYKSLEEAKKSDLPKSKDRQKEIYREYVIGERDIAMFYPQYENCVFPSGERIIEID